MTADEERFEQEKAIFNDGHEDAAEIALAEILRIPEIPIEQLVPYLLWDLTRVAKITP